MLSNLPHAIKNLSGKTLTICGAKVKFTNFHYFVASNRVSIPSLSGWVIQVPGLVEHNLVITVLVKKVTFKFHSEEDYLPEKIKNILHNYYNIESNYLRIRINIDYGNNLMGTSVGG